MCFTALFFKNVSNMAETNCGPLSDTSSSGRPHVAMYPLKTSTVFSDVVLPVL